MAVTFIQQPDLFVSGFDPIIYLASSNQTTQPNFRYRIQIIDASGSVVTELRKPPYYADGTCDLDAHRIIENYLSYDVTNLIAGSVGFKTGVNVYEKFKVNIREEYGTPIINPSASVESGYIYAINSAQTYLNQINKPINGLVYKGISLTYGTFLTNQPSTIDIRVGDSYELGFLNYATNGTHHMRIKTYDESGTLLKNSTFTNTWVADSTDKEHFLSVLCGAGNLNSWSVASGSAQPLIADSVYKYEVMFENSSNTLVSNTLTFKIDRDCTRDGNYNRLYWLNPLGRIDAFNFTQIADDNISVQSSTYNRLQGTRTSSGITFKTYSHERSNFYNSSRQKYSLNSGFVNSETSVWLKELVQSPLIYMIIGGQFVSVNILTTEYQAKSTYKDKLFNVTMEVELSADTKRQRL
jgi:hypothetical protein